MLRTAFIELTSIHWAEGEWQEATDMQEKSLAASRMAFGDNHCNTLTINNLVVSYCSLSWLSESARLQNDALTVCKKKFGEADPLQRGSKATLV